VLFIVTRIALSLLGITTLNFLQRQNQMAPWRQQIAQNHPKLVMWVVWDSGRYLSIAQKGYTITKPFDPKVQQNIGFFPLYALTLIPIGILIGDYVVSGVIVSNLFLIAACFVLYLLFKYETRGTHTDEESEQYAKRGIAYLLIFPTAYIFSAVYPESLLLLLFALSIYSARRNKWLLSGMFGFLAALTKPIGFLVFIPVLLFYLSSKQYSFKKIRTNIIFVFLIPLGLIAFSIYNYLLTGDFLAYAHIQQQAWAHSFSNPLILLWESLFRGDINTQINAIGATAALVLLFVGFYKIRIEYWLFALALILFPLFTGNIFGSLRYLSVVFPLIMILSNYGEKDVVDRSVVALFALFQGGLFIFWICSFWFIS
jgi:hypothetical protein